MDKELLSRIREKISRNIGIKGDSYAVLSNPGYSPVHISEDYFHDFDAKNSENKIAFIDGGNMELISSSGICLSLIRCYYCIYGENKRVEAKRSEFFAFVYSENKGEKVLFKAEIFNGAGIFESDGVLEFDSMDPDIRKGGSRADISSIPGIVRRIAELKIAQKLSEKLSKDDIIILDGNLQPSNKEEEKILERLKRSAPILAAISKTSSLMTDKGNAFSAVLESFEKPGKWYYYPIAHSERLPEIFCVRLHGRSEYIFKLEAFPRQDFNPEEVFGLLASNCRDPVFIGYPYGLIEADGLARIKNNEKDFYTSSLMASFGKEWKKLKPYINTKNAHSVLDSIS